MKKVQICMVLKVSCLAAIISHEIQNNNIIKLLQNYCGMCSDIKRKKEIIFCLVTGVILGKQKFVFMSAFGNHFVFFAQ